MKYTTKKQEAKNGTRLNVTFGPSEGHDTDNFVDQVDSVLLAVGRDPALSSLNLDAHPKVRVAASGHIETDKLQNTGAPGVYALGDVCGFWELTPVAIAAGRRLADRIFSGDKALQDAIHGRCNHDESHKPIEGRNTGESANYPRDSARSLRKSP